MRDISIEELSLMVDNYYDWIFFGFPNMPKYEKQRELKEIEGWKEKIEKAKELGLV